MICCAGTWFCINSDVEKLTKFFDKFQELKYNDIKTWKELKTTYREVGWQVEALKTYSKGCVHNGEHSHDYILDNDVYKKKSVTYNSKGQYMTYELRGGKNG